MLISGLADEKTEFGHLRLTINVEDYQCHLDSLENVFRSFFMIYILLKK